MRRRFDPAAPDAVGPDPSVRLAWITDPHFDHVSLRTWRGWAHEIISCDPHGLIVTGDISEGDDVAYQLECVAEAFDRPIFFVLGNHDFYGSSIAATRREITMLAREYPHLHYLTDEGPVFLKDDAVLAGDDGWGDAREGDFLRSTVRLSDFERINDFREHAPEQWPRILQREGRGSSERLTRKLTALPEKVKHVLIATHVPPYRAACWYDGHVTDDNWAPFFVCGHVGDALRKIAESNPERLYTVLCGHTHHEGDAKILPNLIVHTGYSRYGTLDIESIIQLGDEGFQIPHVCSHSS